MAAALALARFLTKLSRCLTPLLSKQQIPRTSIIHPRPDIETITFSPSSLKHTFGTLEIRRKDSRCLPQQVRLPNPFLQAPANHTRIELGEVQEGGKFD